MLNKIRIRHKLLISYSVVLILSISIGSSFIYMVVRDKITACLESELQNTATAILYMVKTAAAVSIKNHLRAVAEKNLEIIRYFYDQSMKGALTPEAARQMAARMLLAQTIGDSGYLYCIDSLGKVKVHPQTALLETDVSTFAFVREQLARKIGYIEYNWKNPGETSLRPKALYMVYFAPWDWIVSASTYRNEFNGLVNIADFEKSVLQLRLGETGYSLFSWCKRGNTFTCG